MPAIRKTTDPTKLTDDQREALAAARRAQQKVLRGRSTLEGYVAARDDLVRAALAAGVGVNMLAKELGVNGAMIWKIKRNLKTQEAARRREAGDS